MSKQKYLIISGVVIGLLAVSGGGFWYWNNRSTDDHIGPGTASLQATAANVDGGASEQPTDQTQNAPSAGSSLAANSSSTASLGQLTPPSSSSNGGQAGGSTSSSSSSGSNPLDPSTFAQYDKYKNGSQTMVADLQTGTGTTLTSGHQATVYYKGWLTNGELFDQSHTGSDGQLQPFAFTLGAGQVIQGWEQGLAGMKVGGTRLLVIPPSLGYGTAGQGAIPGNSVLVFEVQLLGVK